jgi:hypothetical protein
MQPITVTHPDTGRTATFYPNERTVARFEARGYDCTEARALIPDPDEEVEDEGEADQADEPDPGYDDPDTDQE